MTQIPKKTFPVRLDESQIGELGSIAASLDVDTAVIIRWAIKHYLADYRAGRVLHMPFADGSHMIPPDPKAVTGSTPAHMQHPEAATTRRRKKGAA